MRISIRAACSVFTALTLLLIAGCGESTGPDDGGGDTLTGTVDGSDWTVNAGFTDNFLSNAEELWVILFGDANASCDNLTAPVTAAKLQLRVPNTVGSYELSAAANRELNVFIPPSTSLSIATGTLEVVAVSATAVEAELSVSDQGVVIDGSFTAEICPW